MMMNPRQYLAAPADSGPPKQYLAAPADTPKTDGGWMSMLPMMGAYGNLARAGFQPMPSGPMIGGPMSQAQPSPDYDALIAQLMPLIMQMLNGGRFSGGR